ncbi:MAG: arylsulfatase [Desulfobacterales bacterium]
MKSVGQKFRLNEGSAKMAALGLVLCAVLLAGCASFEQTSGASPGKTAAGVAPASTPQITGVPGSPNATTNIDGRVLPNPPAPFGGVIKERAEDSIPYWPPRVAPPKGAPNVLLIMTDDAGYGVSGTFGGVIPTPALDRIAKTGLRYTQFHSTALCSPSRAALLTGRNHHAVGFGIADAYTGYPGYDAVIGVDNATVGAILKGNGYATSWFGKNHNTDPVDYSTAGPFTQWPTGMGFDYFYGFMAGESDQWTPYLFRNTTQIFPWRDEPNYNRVTQATGKAALDPLKLYPDQPRYNLVTGMAEDVIRHMKELNAADPNQPFFIYYAPGATHAPHQPKQEWRDRFKGRFDMGWNKMREEIFANQKRLGVIPPDTQLTPWPDDLPQWDTLTADEKKMFARQAENFAGYVAYADYEIGRVIQAVEDLGRLDNTLIIYIEGDNGTSAEGTTIGTYNDLAAFQGAHISVEAQLKYYDVWGSPVTRPHMSVAWSWAFDTPFKWTKQVASHFGGTRQGMAMTWPARIKDAGGIRPQFHHFIDIVPTILEAANIPAPATVDGIAQKPMQGVSMAYTWDKANANAASTRKTQYFEILGMRAIYHDGWIASTTPPAPPWLMGAAKMPDIIDGYKWELYDMTKDYSQYNDLAAKYPDKLKEMQKLFYTEAEKNQVLPLDNAVLLRLLTPRPSLAATRNEFTYLGEVSGIAVSAAPNTLMRSYTITANVEVPQGGAEGMLVTEGGRFAGYGLYLLKGKPVFTLNLLDVARIRWAGAQPLTSGRHTVAFEFTYDGPGIGKGGTGVLKVDGKVVDSRKTPHTVPFIQSEDETFDVGVDTRTGVNDADYQVPFRFTGKLAKLTVKLGPPMPPPEIVEMERQLMEKVERLRKK